VSVIKGIERRGTGDMNTSRLGARWRIGGAAVVVIVAVFSLCGTSIALGASSSKQQVKASSTSHGTSAASDEYAKSAKGVAGASGGGSTPPPTSGPSSETLPFTGVSLIWPAVAAIALVALGLGLRRHDRKNG
jgi:hypothetical protein